MLRVLARLLILAFLASVVVAAVAGGRGIGAFEHRALPGEARIARTAWRWLIPKSTRDAANPVPASPEVLKDARAHWADHCAVCHDNDGSGETTVGQRVYPPAPDLRAARTQELKDGELFYAIERGLPWTAMPGWTNGTDGGAKDSWALVRFIRHLPHITPEEITEMETLNPKAPPNEQREKEIDEFLNGPKGRKVRNP